MLGFWAIILPTVGVQVRLTNRLSMRGHPTKDSAGSMFKEISTTTEDLGFRALCRANTET